MPESLSRSSYKINISSGVRLCGRAEPHRSPNVRPNLYLTDRYSLPNPFSCQVHGFLAGETAPIFWQSDGGVNSWVGHRKSIRLNFSIRVLKNCHLPSELEDQPII